MSAERTPDGWRASSIGKAAIAANLELKRVVSLAREERKFKVDTTPGSFVSDCWDAGLVAYNDALMAWLAGDEDKAAKHVIYIGAMMGMATRDSSKLAAELFSKAGKKTAGAPRPNRQGPLGQALRALVAEGMTNDQILAELGNADSISARARTGFSIEVCDPETTLCNDGVLRWYATGGNSDDANEISIVEIRKSLSKIRRNSP